MDKEFTPYEQSLELKELGFDEPCFAIYVDKQLQINATYQNHLEFKGWVATPTFSQAFRWFREKYPKLAAVVVPGNMSEKQRDFFITLYLPDKNLPNITRIYEEIGPYETYEEAELECLKQLIKMVKENKNDN